MQKLRVVNALRTAEDSLALAARVIELVDAKELYNTLGLSKARVLTLVRGAEQLSKNTSIEVNVL